MKKLLWFALIVSLLLSACTSAAPKVKGLLAAPTVMPTPAAVSAAGTLAREYVLALSEGIGPRLAGSLEEVQASQYIASAFRSFGYKPEIQVFNEKDPDTDDGGITSANVVAVKLGQSKKRIIIGAHYDSKEIGKGADDNASGVAVLLETAWRLRDVRTPYTIYFVAFGAGEIGHDGSYYYVNQMADEELAETVTVINLDSLIAGNNAYVYGGHGEGEKIRKWLLAWARQTGLPLQTNAGENQDYPAGTTSTFSDHVPFRIAGITYIYFESTDWLLGEKDSYTQVDLKYGVGGKIRHTEYDRLKYIEDNFPGRVEERLGLFVSALYKICTEYLIQDE